MPAKNKSLQQATKDECLLVRASHLKKKEVGKKYASGRFVGLRVRRDSGFSCWFDFLDEVGNVEWHLLDDGGVELLNVS